MKSDCYFDECKDCEFQDCNDDTMICLINRLGLAFYRLLKELPIINKFMNDYKFCSWFVKRQNDMEIKKNITIELSESDVKEIIALYLKNEGYVVTPDNINLSVGTRIKGFGMGEYEETYFKAAYVKCKEK